MPTTRNNSENKDASKEFSWAYVRNLILILLDQKSAATKKKITTKQLAKELGYNVSTFSKYFSADVRIPCDVLFSIALYFGVSLDYLVGLTKSESNTQVGINELTSGKLSDSARTELSNIEDDLAVVFNELLEGGIFRDILRTFKDYKEGVSSCFLADASSLWFQSCYAALEPKIGELVSKTPKPTDPEDNSTDQLLQILEKLVQTDNGSLVRAFLILQVNQVGDSRPTKDAVKKIKFESAFQMIELISQYGEYIHNRPSTRQLCERLQSELLDLMNGEQPLADTVYDIVGRPPVEKYREEFRACL